MTESAILSALIGDIYDAALDPALWPKVVEDACRFVEGRGASLYVEDVANRKATLFHDFGHDSPYLRSYMDSYVKMNPLLLLARSLPVEQVVCIGDLMPRHEFAATRFYKEWVQAQGLVDTLVVNLDKSATSLAVLDVRRSDRQGEVDAAARRCMALIAPHVRRSVLIGKTMDVHKAEAANLANMASSLITAVFLIDRSGRIVFANEPGKAMVADGNVLRGRQGVLTALNAEANRSLHDALAAACCGGADLEAPGAAIALSALSEARWLAHVLPLTSGLHRPTGNRSTAAAAVFVRKAALDIPTSVETLARIYKLTGSEARVLHGVVEIGGAREIAKALGIAETTVRTHLQSLFAKSGARRQADLVKLVAEHASPLGRSHV